MRGTRPAASSHAASFEPEMYRKLHFSRKNAAKRPLGREKFVASRGDIYILKVVGAHKAFSSEIFGTILFKRKYLNEFFVFFHRG